MTLLDLSVPAQHAYTDPTVERDVNRLRSWLTSMPLMDVVETVRLVGNALDALNEQQLDTRLRFDCLEAFHATAQRLFITVDPLRLSQLSLSKSQRQQAAEGVEKLLLGLVGGYKLVVMSLHEAPLSSQGDTLFGAAVNRSIETLVYILLDGCRFYRAMRPRYFLELHQLYRLARYHGLLNVIIDDGEHDSPVTTAALYHAAMLSSLVDPYRLAEGEISLLFEVLSGHASRCRIIPGSCQPGGEEGLYQIDLGSDAGPFVCVAGESSASMQEPYILDAREALQAVREQLVKIPDKVRSLSPEATLLRQLLPEDQQAKQRSEERHSDERRVQLLLGIDSIHAFLMQASANKASGKMAQDAKQPSLEPFHGMIVDSSDSGMRLCWDDRSVGEIRVGELLAIVEEHHLRLAMVRSVRILPEGVLETGVSLIKGGVGAVYCHSPDDPGSAGSIALFLPSSDDGQGAATLIAAKDMYPQGCHIVIDVAGREIRARAGRQIFGGPVFDRFEFSAE